MKTMKNRLKTPQEIAEQLIDTERQLAAIEESKTPLMKRKEQLRTEMLSALQINRLHALETSNGITFTRAFRASLTISEPVAALRWATAHDCVKIDTVAVAKALRGAGALPSGFSQEETEYLSVRGMKDII